MRAYLMCYRSLLVIEPNTTALLVVLGGLLIGSIVISISVWLIFRSLKQVSGERGAFGWTDSFFTKCKSHGWPCDHGAGTSWVRAVGR